MAGNGRRMKDDQDQDDASDEAKPAAKKRRISGKASVKDIDLDTHTMVPDKHHLGATDIYIYIYIYMR